MPRPVQGAILVSVISMTGSATLAVMWWWTFVKELIEAGSMAPVIDGSYPLSEVPEPLRYLGEGNSRGKIVKPCEPSCARPGQARPVREPLKGEAETLGLAGVPRCGSTTTCRNLRRHTGPIYAARTRELCEHPADAAELVLNCDRVDLDGGSVGDCSQRRHAGRVALTDERVENCKRDVGA
jgi:hypothetical protein